MDSKPDEIPPNNANAPNEWRGRGGAALRTAAFLSGDGLRWSALAVRTPKATLFADAEGHIGRSTMVALVGRSGAGKTTFLRALSRKTAHPLVFEGVVTWDGVPLTNAWVRRHTAHVPTQDALDPALTVGRTLQYYGTASGASSADLRATTSALGLAPLAKRRVRTLSTGERKRLHVATALLRRPTLLCLDEPTSGLSDTDALSFVAVLQRLRRQWDLTVVAVLHAPRYATPSPLPCDPTLRSSVRPG